MRLLILTGVTMISTILLPSSVLAQDYPNYLGPGHREYLNNKIKEGYTVREFIYIENRQKERANKIKHIEKVITTTYQANSDFAFGVLQSKSEKLKNSDELNKAIEESKKQTEQVATAQTEFRYVKYSDGKTVYFKDGLPSSIKNERVVDETGYVSTKNTYNMQYNDKRLLTSYEATLTDNLGNINHIFAYGIRYSPDSVYYADDDTNASKNKMEEFIREIDSAGNVKLSHWKALNYEGKFLRAFSQTIEDSLYGNSSFTRSQIAYENNDYKRPSSYYEEGIGTDGLKYSLSRTDIKYNSNENPQLTSYHEEKVTTHIDGGKITKVTDAKFKYLSVPKQFGDDVESAEPDRLLESTISTTTKESDGAEKTEITTVIYDYDATQTLIGASGNSEFYGRQSSYYDYTDSQGNALTKDVDETGKVTYSYVDETSGQSVIVSPDEVIKTLKEGIKFYGTSHTIYEVPYGRLMALEQNSTTSYYTPIELYLIKTEVSRVTYINGLINNLERMLQFTEHTEITFNQKDEGGNPQREIRDITTTNIYADNANLIDAVGRGKTKGYELTKEGWMDFTGDIEIDYVIILNQRKQKEYIETKHYEYTAKKHHRE
jgi:hypothetical protein